jgi:hypothetical protein
MSSFENPKLKESFWSMSVVRTSPARDSESRVASSSPAKPAPRITTCFIAVTTITRTAVELRPLRPALRTGPARQKATVAKANDGTRTRDERFREWATEADE